LGYRNMAATNAVEIHEAGLIAKVREARRDHPDARPVALVAEADTSEARSIRGKPDVLVGPDGSAATLITRESAKKLLVQVTPRLLDWLEDEGNETIRNLPVIHIARQGLRTGTIGWDASY